jgi:hypothetical protein
MLLVVIAVGIGPQAGPRLGRSQGQAEDEPRSLFLDRRALGARLAPWLEPARSPVMYRAAATHQSGIKRAGARPRCVYGR